MSLPRPARFLAVSAAAAVCLGAATACTAVPDEIDEAARGFGVELNPDRTAAAELQPGDCFFEPEADELYGVRTVDCAGEHDNEILHVVTLPDSLEYPGEDPELWSEHEQACVGQVFENHVGERWEESTVWNVYSLLPDEASWASGDQSLHCVLYRLDGSSWSGSPAAVEPESGAESEAEPLRS
jgi:hypothetical protein